MSDERIEIWTDGSGTLADGPACIGVVIFDGSTVVYECGEFVGLGTNNSAELRAVRRGLYAAKQLYGVAVPLRLISDSEYALSAARDRWTSPRNRALVLAIRKQVVEFAALTLEHVAGHAGIFGNELADYHAGTARVAYFAGLTPPVVKPPKRRPVPVDPSEGGRAACLKHVRAKAVPKVAAPRVARRKRQPWDATVSR